ncbi:hypothetical protein Pelo_3376 [Pelomyxa schiedti]|nr:hypothetical protein Pelo_3376 [Pelomyxa schiedti]
MKSHCALLTNSNCFEIVSFCLVCFQCCSNPSSLGKCSLQIFESAHVLCLPGKLHYRCFDFGLWLLTTIANDPVVASPQNWSILLSCVFAFSWVESSYGWEIMTCSPFKCQEDQAPSNTCGAVIRDNHNSILFTGHIQPKLQKPIIEKSAHVLCLPGKLHYRCFDFGLWLLTAIANDPVVASPQNWSILLSCLFAFSWVESSYRLKSEIMTCSPFSALVNTQHGN